MLYDNHTHTFFSPDGRQSTDELAHAARAAGLAGFTLTDHCDMQGWDGSPYDFRRDESYAAIERARAEYPSLDIGFGVELSDWRVDPAHAAEVISDPRVDFVIGSMHTLHGIDLSFINYPTKAYCELILRWYAEELVGHCAGDFDSLGHLTYPIRYMRRCGFDPDFTAQRDAIAEVFRVLIDRSKSLEINSSGLRQGMGCTLPDEYWLRLYRDLGGEMITLGSDAHTSADVGANISDAAELAKSLGFGYNIVYRKREAIHIPLN